MAAEPGDFAILQLPMGWRNSFGVQGAENTQTQYYQTYHNKRLLSGNISRNPPFKFDYFQQIPILDSLITLQTYGEVDAERRAADRASAAEFVSFYDIRYVVVAPGVPGRPPYVDTREEARGLCRGGAAGRKVYDQDGWLLYRVERSPLPPPLWWIGFGGPRTAMALGEGWAGRKKSRGRAANWAVAQDAESFCRSLTGRTIAWMTALPFDYPGAGEQGVTFKVNGHAWSGPPVSGLGTICLGGSGCFVRAGLNDVRFEIRPPGRTG